MSAALKREVKNLFSSYLLEMGVMGLNLGQHNKKKGGLQTHVWNY